MQLLSHCTQARLLQFWPLPVRSCRIFKVSQSKHDDPLQSSLLRLHNFRGPRCPRGGRENSLASFGRQVRGLLNSSQYVAAATERRSPLWLPIRRVARTVTGFGLRPPSYKARMPFPIITAASAVAAQPPGPSQHQPPSHILIAPGTRDLVTPVSRGLTLSDFVANNASFLSWRDRSSHPWCVV